MKLLYQSAFAVVLALGIASQAWTLYIHRHPKFVRIRDARANSCAPQKISGVSSDGHLICDFDTITALQAWPRLCGCPDFCESTCR